MQYAVRACQSDDDYWRIRAFLRDVFLRNQRRELSWQVARLDYWRYFGNEHIEHYPLQEAITFIETDDGRIVGVVTPESRRQAYLLVDPDLRTLELEKLMLETAETHLAEPHDNGGPALTVWATRDDCLRTEMLQASGYKRGDWPEVQFGRSLTIPVPDPRPVPGYTIRSLGDLYELPARSWASWRAFHSEESDDNYNGWEWYPSIQRCPMYRRDLDLVAVTDEGEVAAFCTLWYDDVTRTGYFEPVGTSPVHQRKGLARQVMHEGLHRLKALGGIHATVAGYSDAAIALYTSVMGPPVSYLERWHRAL